MTETFVKERMHNLTGKVEKVGIDDACTFTCRYAKKRFVGQLRKHALRPRSQSGVHVPRSTAKTCRCFGTCTTCNRLQVFDYKDEGKIRGWKSVHVTDNSPDHPYMANWWVPGLAIGYDASFTHQVADFIQGLGDPASRKARHSRIRWKRKQCWMLCWIPRKPASGWMWRRVEIVRYERGALCSPSRRMNHVYRSYTGSVAHGGGILSFAGTAGWVKTGTRSRQGGHHIKPGSTARRSTRQRIFAIKLFLKSNPIGRVVVESGVITDRKPDTVRGPDVSFYSKERLPLDKEVIGWHDQAPDLCVEVVSPSNSLKQLKAKAKEYLFAGVRIVWIIDPEDRTVTIITEPLESRTLEAEAMLDGGNVLRGFSCKVADLFA